MSQKLPFLISTLARTFPGMFSFTLPGSPTHSQSSTYPPTIPFCLACVSFSCLCLSSSDADSVGLPQCNCAAILLHWRACYQLQNSPLWADVGIVFVVNICMLCVPSARPPRLKEGPRKKKGEGKASCQNGYETEKDLAHILLFAEGEGGGVHHDFSRKADHLWPTLVNSLLRWFNLDSAMMPSFNLQEIYLCACSHYSVTIELAAFS